MMGYLSKLLGLDDPEEDTSLPEGQPEAPRQVRPAPFIELNRHTLKARKPSDPVPFGDPLEKSPELMAMMGDHVPTSEPMKPSPAFLDLSSKRGGAFQPAGGTPTPGPVDQGPDEKGQIDKIVQTALDRATDATSAQALNGPDAAPYRFTGGEQMYSSRPGYAEGPSEKFTEGPPERFASKDPYTFGNPPADQPADRALEMLAGNGGDDIEHGQPIDDIEHGQPIPPNQGKDFPRQMAKDAMAYRDRGPAKAILGRAQGARLGDLGAPETSDQPLGGPSNTPRGMLAQAAMGATPPAVPPPSTPAPAPDELQAAQDAARAASEKGSLVGQLDQATDTIAGTHFGSRGADAVRQRGSQGVADVMQRRTEGRAAADQRLKEEDQGFQRAGEARAVGADQRAITTFGDQQHMNTPGTREARAYEAMFRAKRPAEAAKLSKEQAAQFSANDWKEALASKDDPTPKPIGTGKAGGMKGLTAGQASKLIPENALDTHRTGQEIEDEVAALGGWDKLTAGYAEGAVPTAAVSQAEQSIRQKMAKMLGSYRKSVAGTAVTPSEQANVDKVASIIQGGKTIGELQNGLHILRSLNTSRVEQAIGLQSPDVKQQVRDLFNSKPGSILSPEQATGGAAPAAGTKKGKDGKTYRVFADGSAELVE